MIYKHFYFSNLDQIRFNGGNNFLCWDLKSKSYNFISCQHFFVSRFSIYYSVLKNKWDCFLILYISIFIFLEYIRFDFIYSMPSIFFEIYENVKISSIIEIVWDFFSQKILVIEVLKLFYTNTVWYLNSY